MSEPPPQSAGKEFVGSQLKKRFVAAYVSLSARRPGAMLLLFALVTALLGLAGSRVTVDPRLEALLPKHTSTASANAEARERFAASAPLYLVIQSSDPALNRRLSLRAAEEVRKWPETLWALQRRDPDYFLDRRLLYVDAETLDLLADDIEEYLDWRSCEQIPGCVNLDDEPPEPDFGRVKRHLSELPELVALGNLFGEEGIPDPEAKPVENRAGRPTDAYGPVRGELCSAEGDVCVVQVTIDGDAQDLAFATGILHKAEALLASLVPGNKPSDFKTAVTGVYRNLPLTQEAMMKDLSRIFGLNLSLVMIVLWCQFRFGRAFVLLLAPLILGTVWALGVFSFVSSTLNLISAAVVAVLAGLGDEFSQHLITRFSAERRLGKSAVEAIAATMEDLLSSMGAAALTTGVGFLTLTAARFHGFVQMGLLTFVGVVCIALSTLLVMPPLVLWLDRRRPFTEHLSRVWQMPGFVRNPWRLRPALVVSIGGLALLVFGVFQATRLELEYDFEKLESRQIPHGTNPSKALHGTSRHIVLMLSDGAETLEEAGSGVRSSYPDGLRGNEGPSVVTPGTFVPAGQQGRLAAIARLRALADKADQLASGKTKERIEAWRPLLAVDEPVREQDMPQWVIDQFAERDGAFGKVGVIYQGYNTTDAHQMIELTAQLEGLRARYPEVRFASAAAVLGEIVPLIASDGFRVTGLALLGLVIGVSIIGRSVRRVSLVLLSVCLAVATTANLMVWFDWKVDLYNLLVFPVAFGLGVDGAIFTVWAVYKRRGVTDWSLMQVSSQAVLGATMTTLVAFAGLMASDNGGLASMGKLATLALGMTLVMNLVWLPAALSLIHHHSKRRANAAGQADGLMLGP